MKLFLSSVILFALSVAAAAAYSTVKRSPNSHAKNSQSDMINNYYSANCEKKFHQQLAEIKHEIKQHLAGIKNEIRMLRGNRTECPLGNVSRNCAEIYKSGVKTSGVYKIDPDGLGEFEVFCDQATAGGGWTVFQKRFDGSVDFYRGWDDYKRGFGNLTGEFWLGLDKIHRLTVSSSNKLRVDLEDVPGNTAFAEYSSFAVGNETEKYKLRVGGFSGTAGDSLSYHHGSPFATKDRDNNGCALTNKGAWWYKSCYKSSLNGQYMPGAIDKNPGMNWYYWKNSWISMKRTEMKIRPKRF
ncbi:PREDICTED: microfibril-associated glycoprotein 4-like isoform X2 [Acropora digitifera]|uniref:microfibril-associated glycoprotein 4-like isoform X2 n=1 Tax=Acropora digitifera TaxID=70779 RepID=UPI00077A7070|nr:PREDICTED: microfibril-associated glycoprotein 4-like isoform X2 [Acropora digitifera]